MFKPHIQDVTATAIIKGLAVTKYNHAASRWDVVFLRNCGHHPKLTIRKVDRRSGRIISTSEPHDIVSGDKLSISVKSPAGNIPWKYVTGGAFNRNPSHDPQDFRWMLDIQALHPQGVDRTGDVETNLLSITNACFYTSVLTRKKYKKKWMPGGGKPPVIEKLGFTGSMFGADFKGGSVVVGIEGKPGFPLTLEHNESFRYEIIFNNTCLDGDHPEPGQTDFRIYYNLFDPNKGMVEIVPDDEPGNIGIGGGGTSAEGNSNTDEEEDDLPAELDPEPKPKEPPCQSINDGDSGS